jgi:hypothetical protein
MTLPKTYQEALRQPTSPTRVGTVVFKKPKCAVLGCWSVQYAEEVMIVDEYRKTMYSFGYGKE